MPATVETTELIPMETREKIEKALEFLESIEHVEFTKQKEYDYGVEICKSIKNNINELEKKRKELATPHYNKFKEINSEFDVIKMLQDTEKIFKNGMNQFFQEQERKRIEHQRKLDAEAEAKRRQEEERARREAEKAEMYREKGRDEMAAKAEARAETAQTVADTIVAPVVENQAKTSGVSYKTVYKISVEDENKAILACVGNPVLRQYVSLDVPGLQRLAQAQKGRFECDGIRVIEDKQVTVRTK